MQSHRHHWLIGLLLILGGSAQAECLKYLHATLIRTQLEHSLEFIVENTGARMGGEPGAVIASKGKTNEEYHFHWVRDAALTHIELIRWLRKASADHPLYETIKAEVMAGPVFNARLQANMNLAEREGTPKFGIDGSPYAKENATPQKDGPALRALATLELAEYLYSQGDRASIEQLILNSQLLSRDLDYVAAMWKEPTHFPADKDPPRMSRDSWEEIPAEAFFYNRMVQRAAFVKAIALYEKLGMKQNAEAYRGHVKAIEDEFESFWRPDLGVYEFAKGDKWTTKWDFKRDSRTDVLVMLGALHGKTDDGFMSVTNSKMQSTVHQIVKQSKEKFALNHDVEDGAIMIFRYFEDDWDGVRRHSQGYPWGLATAGYAQFLAEMQTSYMKSEKIVIDEYNLKFFNETILLGRESELSIGLGTYARGSEEYDRLMDAIETRSYAVYVRLLDLASRAGGHISEGMDPRAEAEGGGEAKGPEDLTWSHVAVYSAAHALAVPIVPAAAAPAVAP